MNERLPAPRQVLLVIIAAAVAWFALPGYRDLIDPDEGRYAEIPREMLVNGDWVTPRLDGVKYFEKPPLQYWLTATTCVLAGAGTVTARLWVAIAGFGCALWTAWLGYRLFDRQVGHLTFLLSISGLLYVSMGHVLTLDMTLTLFLTVTLGSAALAQTQRDNPGRSLRWMLVGWAALAAAVLTKGPVAIVLAGAAVSSYLLWQRDWPMLRTLHPVQGLLVLIILTAPWFLAVSARNPEFPQFFFVHEHWERFTTGTHGREGPIYYFVGVLLLGALPWTLLSLRTLLRPRFAPLVTGIFDPEKFLWVYVWVVLIFFSVSQSKLPAYILPVFPFLALLSARRLTALVDLRADGWALLAFAGTLVALSAMAPRFATDNTPAALLDAFRPWVVGSAACFAAAALVLLFGRATLISSASAVALIAVLAVQCLAWGAQSLAPSRSGRQIADHIAALDLPAATPLYFVGHYSPSLAFYLGRVPLLAEYTGELSFGSGVEPGLVMSQAEFSESWQARRQALAIIDKDDHQALIARLPGTVIYEDPRRMLALRQAQPTRQAPARQAGKE